MSEQVASQTERGWPKQRTYGHEDEERLKYLLNSMLDINAYN